MVRSLSRFYLRTTTPMSTCPAAINIPLKSLDAASVSVLDREGRWSEHTGSRTPFDRGGRASSRSFSRAGVRSRGGRGPSRSSRRRMSARYSHIGSGSRADSGCAGGGAPGNLDSNRRLPTAIVGAQSTRPVPMRTRGKWSTVSQPSPSCLPDQCGSNEHGTASASGYSSAGGGRLRRGAQTFGTSRCIRMRPGSELHRRRRFRVLVVPAHLLANQVADSRDDPRRRNVTVLNSAVAVA